MSITSHGRRDGAVQQSAGRPSGIAVLDETVSPHEKSRYVRSMFDAIAPRYDLLNSLLSLRVHHAWRKMAARCAALVEGDSAIDVCSGTGDLAAQLRRRVGESGMLVGVDFSLQMLQSGAALYRRENIPAIQADAMNLPFDDDQFDAATIAFGLRNVAEPLRGLAEMARVVKPAGRVVCLEFSEPSRREFRALYQWYGRNVMPRIGRLVSGAAEAYTYLPESVARWKSRGELRMLMEQAGLVDVRVVDMTFGIVCIHVGTKRSALGNGNGG